MNVIMLLKHKDSLKYIYEDNTLRQGLEKMRAHSVCTDRRHSVTR